MHPPGTPVALTIAGSDSGGDAGIQADLKVFAQLKVHGVTAITCLTAQNPGRISRLTPTAPIMVRAQLESVAAHFIPAAAKTGMLYSAAIVRKVAIFFETHPKIPLVVDPVMVSTSGRRLLQPNGIEALKNRLLPLAAIVTPNLAEAEVLAGGKIRSLTHLRAAAQTIYRTFGCAALVKGGHLSESGSAVDFYYGPEGEWMISSARTPKVVLHGAGCTYSAAITGFLALGKSNIKAIELAKDYITRAIHETRGNRRLALRPRGF
jgi:hydroxymethylpyrimidine/phosphomethylpyrimidine kinase